MEPGAGLWKVLLLSALSPSALGGMKPSSQFPALSLGATSRPRGQRLAEQICPLLGLHGTLSNLGKPPWAAQDPHLEMAEKPRPRWAGHGAYLMASHISSPIFTQLRAWVGRDTGRPDTQ